MQTKVRPISEPAQRMSLRHGDNCVGFVFLFFSLPQVHFFNTLLLHPNFFGGKKKKISVTKKTSLCFAKSSSFLGSERGWLALSPHLTKLLFLGMCSRTGRKQMLRNKEVKTGNRFFTTTNAKRKHDLFSCV